MFRVLGGIALVLATTTLARAEAEDPKALFDRATVEFRLGQFHDAAKTYERVYELRPDPVLLYNCAQSYRLANEPDKALVLYKSFLSAKPDAPNREEVEGRIAELEHVVAERKAKENPPTEVAQPPPPTTTEAQPSSTAPTTAATTVAPAPARQMTNGRTKAITGIALLGVGVGAVVGGVVAAVFSGRASDAINAEAKSGAPFDPSKESAGNIDTIVSGVMFGVGAAAIVGGGVLLVLGIREGKVQEKKLSLLPLISPTTMGATASIRF